MAKYKNTYRIEPNRHQYWNYSRPGGYFITINTHNRVPFLGHISNGKMHHSVYGQIVHNEINCIPDYHHQVQIGASIIMPDHIHLIVNIATVGGHILHTDDRYLTHDMQDTKPTNVEKIHEFSLPTPSPIPVPTPRTPSSHHKPTIDEIKQYRKQRRKMIIPKIIGKLKMKTSKQINIKRETPQQKNWQANYHDHIIRDQAAYLRIQEYIKANPQNWKKNRTDNS